MKVSIEYKSNTLLPEEIKILLKETEKKVRKAPYETDKINCYFGELRYKLIQWIDKNSIIEK